MIVALGWPWIGLEQITGTPPASPRRPGAGRSAVVHGARHRSVRHLRETSQSREEQGDPGRSVRNSGTSCRWWKNFEEIGARHRPRHRRRLHLRNYYGRQPRRVDVRVLRAENASRGIRKNSAKAPSPASPGGNAQRRHHGHRHDPPLSHRHPFDPASQGDPAVRPLAARGGPGRNPADDGQHPGVLGARGQRYIGNAVLLALENRWWSCS